MICLFRLSQTKGTDPEIDSVVANQYMDSIRAAVLETLKEFDVSTGKIFIKDKGALDCVIRARMETALKEGEWKRYEKNHAVFTGKHSQYADKWGYSGCRHHHFDLEDAVSPDERMQPEFW